GAGQLKMIFGAMAAQLLQLAQDRPRLRKLTLEPVDAGALQVDFAGGVALLFRALVGLQRLVVVMPRGQSPPQIVIGDRAFALLEMLDGVGQVAEERGG